MKIISKILMLAFFVSFISCGSDNDEEPKEPKIKKLTEFPKFDIKKTIENGIKKVTITDLYTSNLEGEEEVYYKFNLEKGEYVKGDNWDIAFHNRAIIVNGGETVKTGGKYGDVQVLRKKDGADAAIAIMGITSSDDEIKPENLPITAKESDGDFLKIKEVPSDIKFKQDKKFEFAIDDLGCGMFEYNASPFGHIVTVKKNRFLIIRTHDGHYAKLKLLSYYQGAGATAHKSVETGSMEEGMIYANFFTFTYYYNTEKGNKKLQ